MATFKLTPTCSPLPFKKKTTHTEWKRKSFLQIVFTNPIDSLFINTHKNNFTFILSYKSSPKAMSKNRVPSWSNLIRLFLSLPRSVPMTTLVIATPRSAGLLAQFPGMGPPSLAGLMLPGHPGLMGMPRFRWIREDLQRGLTIWKSRGSTDAHKRELSFSITSIYYFENSLRSGAPWIARSKTYHKNGFSLDSVVFCFR